MPDPIPEAREHKQIGDDLDAAYVDAVRAATYAYGFLNHHHGNPNEVYDRFYDPFVTLFQYTSSTREMTKGQDNVKLILAIERWMEKDTRRYNVRELLKHGLYLFKFYRKAVIKSGAVVIKRE